jgi:hypothetical protein
MLAVVVADVHIEGEYQFERRHFGSNPEQLRLLAEWLLEQMVEEAVMESTAQYWKPVWGALEQYWSRVARNGKVPSLFREPCIWRRRNLIAGGKDEREISPTPNDCETASGPRTGAQLRAGCRAASLAHGDAWEVSVEAQSCTVVKPIRGSARRSAY